MSIQYAVSWQIRQADLVNDEIEALLDSLSGVSGYSDIIREPLAGLKHRLVSKTAHHQPWYLLPLVVCEAISGHYKQAVPASAALQLFMAAGEAFDDIEDADAAGSLLAKYGSAIATNAATTFLILAERAICRLKARDVADSVIIRIMSAVNSFYTTACAGQYLDLSLTPKTTLSEDNYFRVASMKSATTIECACHIGAVLATVNQDSIDLFTVFGHNLGIASQIANDIQGIVSGSDIAKHKITLPVIYALTHTKGEVHAQLKLAFNELCESYLDLEQIRGLLFKSGAVLYSMIKMETVKEQALDILNRLETTGVNVKKLRLFLK